MGRKRAAHQQAADTPSSAGRKERFVARTKRRGREAWSLGNTLIRDPGAFPGAAGTLLKRSIRTFWMARGGGFYACGFVVTFLWLEVRTLADELGASDGVVAFFSEQIVEFLFRFSVQSLVNSIQALVWPVFVLERLQGWGILLLAAGFLSFDRLFKGPLTRWLFDEQAETATASGENQCEPGQREESHDNPG